jgi:hypothetical protein
MHAACWMLTTLILPKQCNYIVNCLFWYVSRYWFLSLFQWTSRFSCAELIRNNYIDNEAFQLIIYCFECVRHIGNATFETRLKINTLTTCTIRWQHNNQYILTTYTLTVQQYEIYATRENINWYIFQKKPSVLYYIKFSSSTCLLAQKLLSIIGVKNHRKK